MPGFLLTVGASLICPHGGQITAVTSNRRVLVDGQPALIQNDNLPVTGCAFTKGTALNPCTSVRWLTAATRVLINGTPAVLQDSTGMCISAAQEPQGPLNVVTTQVRVKGI